MNTRHALIAKALRQRHIEVCRTIAALSPAEFQNIQELVLHTQELTQQREYAEWKIPTTWFQADFDCLTTLRKLALGEKVGFTVCLPPAGGDFVQTLRAAPANSNGRFQLLALRYSHPLNFSSPGEDAVREYVLERLMVQDRALIERQSTLAVHPEDLFLKLNLVAVHASTTTDLRFLDALNYYYELLFSGRNPTSQHSWMFVSFLALYARSLWVRLAESAVCA